MESARRQGGYRQKMVFVVILLLCLFVGGCSGITPGSEPLRDNREEGPEKGLFSGPDGEFVLLGPASKESPAEQESTPSPAE